MKAAFGKQLIDRFFPKGLTGQPQLTRFVGKSG
jgi:hypothetical protein